MYPVYDKQVKHLSQGYTKHLFYSSSEIVSWKNLNGMNTQQISIPEDPLMWSIEQSARLINVFEIF